MHPQTSGYSALLEAESARKSYVLGWILGRFSRYDEKLNIKVTPLQLAVNILKNHGARFAISAGLLYGTFVLPHTLGMQKYRTHLLALKEGDGEKKITQHLQKISDELASKATETWDSRSSSKLQFFMTINHDPVHIGATKGYFGALVGIPGFYKYRETSEVELHRLGYLDNRYDFSTPEGLLYIEAIVLSDEAKKFGIMREMNYANSHWYQVRGFLAALAGGYAVSSFKIMKAVVSRLNPGKKVFFRFLLTGVIGCFSWGMFFIPWDFYNRYRDRRADKLTLEMGPEFVRGAEEFYSKQLERNKALHIIIGYDGMKIYDYDGNMAVGLLRTPHVPITKRLENVKKYAKEKGMAAESSHDTTGVE